MNFFSRPPAGFKWALLYVSHMSADDELRQKKISRLKLSLTNLILLCLHAMSGEQVNLSQIHAEMTFYLHTGATISTQATV